MKRVKEKEPWRDLVDGDIEEGFCGLCLTVPLAFAGAGASAYGASGSKKTHKTAKKVSLWAGVVAIVTSVLIALYYLIFKKDCKACK